MAKAFTFPSEIGSPQWVQNEAQEAKGLDLLGLRLIVQALQAQLLNGVTTVTPRIRYLSLRIWLVDAYWARAGRADTRGGFKRFSAAGEAALALANVHHDPLPTAAC
jgi:hypothetical protein